MVYLYVRMAVWVRGGVHAWNSPVGQDLALYKYVYVVVVVVFAPPHVHIIPILRHLHWLPVRARISDRTACLCFNAITSSTSAYLSDLLHLYPPSRSLRYSADNHLLKILLCKCKTKGDRAFSYLVLLSGTRCHCTLECYNYRHLPVCYKNLSLQPPRIWLAHICLICSVKVCVCGGGVRERERECVQQIWLCFVVWSMYIYAESERNICVIILLPHSPLLLHDLVKRLELLRIGVWK